MEDPLGHSLIHHLAQNGPGSAAAVLRRVADTLDSIEGVDVQDIVFHAEITADAPIYDVVVYYSLPGDPD